MTEMDLSGKSKKLGTHTAQVVAAFLFKCQLLTTLRISGQEGEETSFIKKKHCTGSSFEEGDIVQYKGQACKVTSRVDSDGELKVRPLGAVVTMEASMTELDLDGKKLGPDVAQVLAAFLPRCTALASANLLRTGFGVPQAQALVEAVKAHPTLKSVCGLRGDESVVDMSGKSLGAEDMVLLAGELKAMESMTELDLTESHFGDAGTAAIVGV